MLNYDTCSIVIVWEDTYARTLYNKEAPDRVNGSALLFCN